MLRPCFPRITNGGEKPAIRISDIAPGALVGDIMFVNGAMAWRAQPYLAMAAGYSGG